MSSIPTTPAIFDTSQDPSDQPLVMPTTFTSGGLLPATQACPGDGQPFDPATYISLPAIGVTATVVLVSIDDGMVGIFRSLANVFVGTGWTEGSGSLIWQLLDNGNVVRNYDNIVSSLGAVNNPRPIGGAGGFYMAQEGHQVILQVTNVSLAVGGAEVGGRLSGWYCPKWRIPDEYSQF